KRPGRVDRQQATVGLAIHGLEVEPRRAILVVLPLEARAQRVLALRIAEDARAVSQLDAAQHAPAKPGIAGWRELHGERGVGAAMARRSRSVEPIPAGIELQLEGPADPEAQEGVRAV